MELPAPSSGLLSHSEQEALAAGFSTGGCGSLDLFSFILSHFKTCSVENRFSFFSFQLPEAVVMVMFLFV